MIVAKSFLRLAHAADGIRVQLQQPGRLAIHGKESKPANLRRPKAQGAVRQSGFGSTLSRAIEPEISRLPLFAALAIANG
ncbi:hypothetical protein V6C53_08220 [Desulfocurvibacter africanus]|uniref:hypothetical protein n=1 Tax=Desulfocurvibacter africanus TaxID=873 RepID=UPI002FD9D16B